MEEGPFDPSRQGPNTVLPDRIQKSKTTPQPLPHTSIHMAARHSAIRPNHAADLLSGMNS